MWRSIFNPQNGFFQAIDLIFNVAALSLLWVALCLPLVTAGPATAALYYSLVKCIRRGEPYPFKNFFESFRLNLKQGIFSGIICLIAGEALAHLLGVSYQMALAGNKTAVVLLTAEGVLSLALLGVVGLLFPVLSRFTLKLGDVFGLSFRLAATHPLATLAAGIVLAAGAFLAWLTPVSLLVVPRAGGATALAAGGAGAQGPHAPDHGAPAGRRGGASLVSALRERGNIRLTTPREALQ